MTRATVDKLSLQAKLSLCVVVVSLGLSASIAGAQSGSGSARSITSGPTKSITSGCAPSTTLDAASTSTSEPAPLAGAIDCQTSLKNIGHAARHIEQATLDIVNDVEQRKLAATPGDPLVDNPPVNNVKDAQVWSQQMSEMGPLEQPKPQWLDADISHLEKWLAVLNDDFAGTAFGATQKEAAAATWNELLATLRDINSHFKQLQELSVGPHFNNLEIGKAALRIHDDIAKLDKPWHDTVKIVQGSSH